MRDPLPSFELVRAGDAFAELADAGTVTVTFVVVMDDESVVELPFTAVTEVELTTDCVPFNSEDESAEVAAADMRAGLPVGVRLTFGLEPAAVVVDDPFVPEFEPVFTWTLRLMSEADN
jgi:hypothetical protein